MNIAGFFIERPVFASVLAIVTVVVGLVALVTLPVSQYPDIVPPTVIVTASYPGANAQTVADTVATPIEEQVNGVENMLYMSSQSTDEGQMRLTVTFKLGTNLDVAQVQVQNRVSLATPQLPEEVQRLGVSTKKSSPDITLVAQLYSPDGRYDLLYLSNYATLQIRDELARVEGVGDVIIFGARDYSMRIWLDPNKLASLDMTAMDVVGAIREQNVQVAAGIIGGPPVPPGSAAYELTVRARGRLETPEQFANVVIKTGPTGQVVRIRDVGRVELGAQDYAVSSYLDGKPAVAVAVFQLPGSNSITTANAIYQRMEELKARFPQGMDYELPYDTTRFVRESVADVIQTLLIAVGLVVLVVLLFLQNWRAALIPLLAIPVSLIGTLAVMKILGFSLNNLSLFGLVLAIGIVVDDAIVVVENIERWLDRGLEAHEAAHKAMIEVTPAVIAVAAGLSAVFIPTAFISGISGQFYRQFALTIATSTLLSAFNSLTLSPALAALLLKPRHARPDWFQRSIDAVLGWPFEAFEWTLGHGTNVYTRIVGRLVRISTLVMLVYAGLLVATYFAFQAVPTGFIPSQDTGYLLVNLQLPDAAAVERTDKVIRRLAETAGKTPGVAHTFAISGFSAITGVNQSNTASMFVVLKDFGERSRHPEESGVAILGKLMKDYSQVEEGLALVFPPPPVRGLSNAGGFRMQIEDRSGDRTPQELEAATNQVLAAARKHGEVQGLFTSFSANVPQLDVTVAKTKVKSEDVALTDVYQTLQIYLGSLYVNDFTFLGRTYHVTAQAEPQYRISPADIVRLKTRNREGGMVPLGAVLEVREITGPSRIGHYNLYTTAEINGSAALGVSGSTATDLMEGLAKDNLPPGLSFEWTDLVYQAKLAGNTAIYIFPLCVLFVFLVHSAEYESFALPAAIVMIVPMCLLCAIAGVWLRGKENDIFTQIGFVVLAGLSMKNAVLIVEFAKQQEHGENEAEGRPLEYHDAAVEASRLRLRPILMTSLAFILGVVPLLIARGAGWEMRQSIGTAVFFGMLGVTAFGIFLTPVFYVVIRWLTRKIMPERRRRAAEARE